LVSNQITSPVRFLKYTGNAPLRPQCGPTRPPWCGPTHPTTGRMLGELHILPLAEERHPVAHRCWGHRTTRLAWRLSMPCRSGPRPLLSSPCSPGESAICRCRWRLGSIPMEGISGSIGYSSWYNAHTSSTIRFRGLNPVAAAPPVRQKLPPCHIFLG
jgi:hypothetical protein